jgi:hypothetical protein
MMERPPLDSQISYRWALDETGRPVPIEQAERGQPYVCPLCRGPMIPRLGQQVQHHFGHEHLTHCTPETVNRAVLRRWLGIGLEQPAAGKRAAIPLSWKCPHCAKAHHADLMAGVATFVEGAKVKEHFADIALCDEAGRVLGAILIQDQITAEEAAVFTKGERLLLLLPHSATPGQGDLGDLLRQARVLNGPCPVLRGVSNLVREPDDIRAALMAAVEKFPAYAYGAVETTAGAMDLVRIGDKHLLLNRERWKQIIGGARNSVAPGVEILLQTWQHTDGGVIYLYFVSAHNTHAVGVKRYSPGAVPSPHLDERMYRLRTTAVDIARQLVRG